MMEEVQTLGKAESRQVERRQHIRLGGRGKARLLLLPDGPAMSGLLVNLSLGGCGIEFEKKTKLAAGCKIELQLSYEGFTLRLLGVVRYSEDDEDDRVGIGFTDVSRRKEEQIAQLLEELKEQEKAREEQIRLGTVAENR